MGTKRVAFYDEEAKEQFEEEYGDPVDLPVIGEGAAEGWRVVDEPNADGFVIAEAPGDGDLDVVQVRKLRETTDWERFRNAGLRNKKDVQVPDDSATLEVTIQESNVVAKSVPGFPDRSSATHAAEHTVVYDVDLDDGVASFRVHRTPDRGWTKLSTRLAHRARKLADNQVEEREDFDLAEPATAVDTDDTGLLGPRDEQRSL